MADSNPYTTNSADADETTSAASGYCQQCGRALTSGTLRRLGGGIFCVPCAAQHSAGSRWQAVPTTPSGGAPGQDPVPAVSSSGGPNSVWACILGFIPGVGAMYNGQYAKAALHLIVFVVLVMLADNLNWAFYWFVWGWVFYQAFDAYHTARARRDGLPLPDPFGWNELGERWGFPTSAVPGASRPYSTQRRDETLGSEGHRTPFPQGRDVPTKAGAPATPPSAWRDAVATHPTNHTTAPYSTSEATGATRPFPDIPASSAPRPRVVGWQAAPATPYSPTYVGDSSQIELSPSAPTHRFPVGAVWLVGLGLLFLFGNVLPRFAIRGPWLVPVLLLGVALWSGSRRVTQQRRSALTQGGVPNYASALAGPVVLLTLAVLMAFQAAEVLRLGRTWPILLVVWGVMLLARRAAAPAATVHGMPDLSDFTQQAPMSVSPTRSSSGTGSLGL